MRNRTEIVQYLRDHIIGAMHVGQVRAGDRLPSIREVAQRLGKNERTVKAAYEALAAEGIVEIRGRSGVFAAQQEVAGGEVSEEKARWLMGVIAEAWQRRIAIPALSAEVHRHTVRRRIRCTLVDPVEDGAVALRQELANEWGFDVQVIGPEHIDDVRDTDFFAATSFYASTIHAAIEARGIPLVVLTAHAGLQEAIRARVEAGRLIVVAVDAHFVERIRASYAPDHAERVELVLAHDSEAVSKLDPNEPILLTKAARGVLGHAPAPLLFPHSPTLSLETARALAAIVVRLNSEV